MRRCLPGLVLLGLMLFIPTSAAAAEPFLEFLDALRAKQYHDYAILYLEHLEGRSDVPADVRTKIDFEKALTFVEWAPRIADLETRTSHLKQAESLFERFVRAHPDHPRAARANSERARILLARARINIWRARGDSSDDEKRRRSNANDEIAMARELFQRAHDRHKQSWDELDAYIDKGDKEKVETRQRVEAGYLQSQFDLAMCTYEEAQTFERSTSEFTQFLKSAAEAFVAIHERYRDQIVGLHARLWQGKCFEEQNEIGKALGIYNELLRHGGKTDSLERLQDHVELFRLICLNHEKRHDYQLVIDEASTWLAGAKSRARSKIGLGIRFELARATEAIGLDEDLPPEQRERMLSRALDEAREINKFPGEYQAASRKMIVGLLVALDRDVGDPEDFQNAFASARDQIASVSRLHESLQQPNQDENTLSQLRTDFELSLKEAERSLRLTMRLADQSTPPAQLNQVRYFLAYVHYLKKQSYESAVVAEYLARKSATDDAQAALSAAILALAAYRQAFDAAGNSNPEFELDRMEQLGQLIASNWSDRKRAEEAWMMLGSAFQASGRPAEAAAWYARVLPSTERYGEAQIAAGQSYWSAYIKALRLPDDLKRPQDELEQWQVSAEKHLRAGVEASEAGADQADAGDDSLVSAKVFLAQILLHTGQPGDALSLLTAGQPSVVDVVSTDDSGERPATGIHSRAFVSLCYRVLIRCYVGTQQVDKGLAALDQLEKVTSEDDSGGSAAIYVQLGQEIQREIGRLAELADPARLEEVRSSFDQFLDLVYERRAGMKYGALVWMATTYRGLGEGLLQRDRAATKDYYRKAARVFEEILTRDDVPPTSVNTIKLQLAESLVRADDFAAGEKIVRALLADNGNLVDAQILAAELMQDWGIHDSSNNADKLLVAINGDADAERAGAMWGWARISDRLQRAIDTHGTQDEKRDEYLGRYWQARYNVSECRREYGLVQTDPAKRTRALEAARVELQTISRLGGEIQDDRKRQFNQLYRDVLADLKQPASDLDWAESVAIVETGPSRDVAPANEMSATSRTPSDDQPSPPATTNTVLMIFVILVTLGAAGGFVYVLLVRDTDRQRRRMQRSALGRTAPRRASSTREQPAEAANSGGRGASGAAPRSGNRPNRR